MKPEEAVSEAEVKLEEEAEPEVKPEEAVPEAEVKPEEEEHIGAELDEWE